MADSEHEANPNDEVEERSVSSTFAKSAKIALIVLVLLVVAIAVASWLGGDASTLPFDYEGFD